MAGFEVEQSAILTGRSDSACCILQLLARISTGAVISANILSSRGASFPRGGWFGTEIDKGMAGFTAGAPPPFHAVGHLFSRSMGELESALGATAAEFAADQRKYTDVQSFVQISEVVE